MIRIPFFSHPETELGRDTRTLPAFPREAVAPDRERVDRVEVRLAALEDRLVSHAEELKSNIGNRVMRIQSRVERAMRPFQPESERMRAERSADNILEFGSERPGKPEPTAEALHARNAREAMLELNETLRQTREHLEALFGSIDRMKRSVSSGR
jgi:hypothetical protein